MELVVQVVNPAEWSHINQLVDGMEHFHGEVDTPHADYDLLTLMTLEYEKEISPLTLHLMWTNYMITYGKIMYKIPIILN